MSASTELGISISQPYGGYSFFLSDAQYTEVAKFVPKFADIFPRIRVVNDLSSGGGGYTYPNSSTQCSRIWSLALKAYKPSIYILYGTTNNTVTITGSPELSWCIPSAYVTFRTYLLQEAQWAQDNGMDAFLVGNENLISNAHSSVGMAPTTLSRTSNVATATFSYAHGLTTGDYIFVAGSAPSSFNVAESEVAETVQCTVVNSTTITYPSTGTDGSATNIKSITKYEFVDSSTTKVTSTSHGFSNGNIVYVSGSTSYNGRYTISGVTTNTFNISKAYTTDEATGTCTPTYINWSAYEMVRKTKAIAASCQAVFTRGPIVYTESQGHENPWIVAGITPGTDIDLMGYNGYGDGTNTSSNYTYWKTNVDNMFAKFGTNLIITEHNVVQDSGNQKVNNFNKNNSGFEEYADAELIRRYEYAKGLGITQIYLFSPQEYPLFCNTYPNNTYNDAYIVGDFKPIINKLRGLPVNKKLWGVNTAT